MGQRILLRCFHRYEGKLKVLHHHSLKNIWPKEVLVVFKPIFKLSPLASKELDTCEDTLLNSRTVSKKDTLGNTLCDQAIRFLKPTRKWKKQNIGTLGLRNQKMIFYYSACGSDWKPIHDSATNEPLRVETLLCCKPDGTYEPCDGSTDFTRGC